jgi:hypothetical protein
VAGARRRASGCRAGRRGARLRRARHLRPAAAPSVGAAGRAARGLWRRPVARVERSWPRGGPTPRSVPAAAPARRARRPGSG